MRTDHIQLILLLSGISLLAACSEEPAPRTVSEFLESPIMLEAAMVRCSEDRKATRYDAECVNARQAVSRIEAKKERERQSAFDAQSERKRQALRRTQEAVTQARQRAAEAERRKIEEEYLAQFGVELPPEIQSDDEETDFGNSPLAVIPASDNEPLSPRSGPKDAIRASDGGNAPVAISEPEEETPQSELP